MADRRRNLGLPAGVVFQYAGTTDPYGYLICDGREVLRSEYPALFAAIGTSHGIGNGTTTFNIPDHRYLVPRGRGGVANQAILPAAVNITTEEITVTGHEYRRTGFRVRVSSTGTIIGGLAINTDYYVIVVNANTIKLATTRANAIANTAINLTSQGTGTHTISQAEGPDFSSRTAVNGGNAGDNIGSLEEDTSQAHSHSLKVSGAFTTGTASVSRNNFNDGPAGGYVDAPVGFDAGGSPRISSETRQSNILTNYIIKV